MEIEALREHPSWVSRRVTKLSDDPVARRLALTRIALGYDRQEAFAREAGIAANTYNPFERNKRRLNLENARKLCDKYGLTLEWLFDGIPTRLPHGLVMKLVELGALPLIPGMPATPDEDILRKPRR